MKKFLGTACAALMMASMLATSASAALGDIKYDCYSTTKAPVMDGKVTQEEYAGNAPIVLDGSGKNTEGTWTSKKWANQIIKYYYTWDKDNVYVGITVENDTSESQSGLPAVGSATCPFGKGDSVQLGFNPGGIINGTHPLIYCVGFQADGQPVVHGDAFHSTKDGEQTIDASSFIKGYSKKYSATGLNYECEVTIPWSKILMNGAGRSKEGAKVFDMTGEKIKDGYVMPIFLVYVDTGDGTTHMRTDSTTGNKWVAEEMGSVALVLKETKVTSSANTFDPATLAVCAAATSGIAALVLKKKRG